MTINRTSALHRMVVLAVLMISSAAVNANANSNLLFSLSGEQGVNADFAAGSKEAIFAAGVHSIQDGVAGKALRFDPKLSLAWSAPGNIYAKRGTLSFYFRANTPLTEAPFPLFRVSSSDSSTWDFDWLRIDWNGAGFDAFVTDVGLARTRVSTTLPAIPDSDEWLHIAFAWSEAWGVKLWVNGKLAAARQRQAIYDQGLWGMGPLQRIVAPWSVHSAYNFMRPGDLDELRVFDRMLADVAVAQLAKDPHYSVWSENSATDSVSELEYWNHKLGFNQAPQSVARIPGPALRIKKVGLVAARDLKQTIYKGVDGIRETTWPGVYNRSALPGRKDYFVLPDWNVYSSGGKTYQLTLAEEAWNYVEINGSAFGTLSRIDDEQRQELGYRAKGLERSSHHWSSTYHGGQLLFTNDLQELPIEEIGVYHIEPGEAPSHAATLDYRVIIAESPEEYSSLQRLNSFIHGRYLSDERSQVLVAMPDDPLLRYKPPANNRELAPTGLPIVHILIPADFRSPPTGRSPTRFSYGWQNMNAGLDGISLEIPALGLRPHGSGLIPLNIRIKDPSWPARDLLDVNIWINPGETQRLWLDTRDLILPEGESFYLTLASNRRQFSAQALKDTRISLRFKARADAELEHVHERLEQARDNLANLVEEQPNTRLFPLWDRFERDISAVLKVAPENTLARSLWVEKNPEQPYQLREPGAALTDAPAWAWYQREGLRAYSYFVNWWIDNRQVTEGESRGEFGGGLSDDTDLLNQWVPLALMGVDGDKIRRSQLELLAATYRNGMWSDGLNRLQTDELHAYEEGVNAVAQALQLNWGSPSAVERAMSVARNFSRLFEANSHGHLHFVSIYYSGTDIQRTEDVAWQRDRSFLITHPGLLLVDYNDTPQVRELLLATLDDWLAHAGDNGSDELQLPAEIHWNSDQGRGSGIGLAAHNFWAAYRWTGDKKYLRPMMPWFVDGDLAAISGLNADVLHRLPEAGNLRRKIADRVVAGERNYIDRNLGGMNTRDFADLVLWQETGEKESLVDLYRRDRVSYTGRMPYLTLAEAWTDRVALGIEALQRSRLGGVALLRNAHYPGNVLSWRFRQDGKPVSGEDIAILIPKGNPEKFKVIAYNFMPQTNLAIATGWDIAPGQWKIVEGPDRNDDEQMDSVAKSRTVRFEKGADVELELPSREVKVFEFELLEPGSTPAQRPDIALEDGDILLDGETLNITLHSLGSKPTPAGTIILQDLSGQTLATLDFDPLEAPTDLLPKTRTLGWRIPAGQQIDYLRIRARLAGDPEEISRKNNVAVYRSEASGG